MAKLFTIKAEDLRVKERRPWAPPTRKFRNKKKDHNRKWCRK